jgi:hypothetical protein
MEFSGLVLWKFIRKPGVGEKSYILIPYKPLRSIITVELCFRDSVRMFPHTEDAFLLLSSFLSNVSREASSAMELTSFPPSFYPCIELN